MQRMRLADLQDVLPVDDRDLVCLAELRDVLARHGKLERFAVHLAHRHFVLGPDEILIERPDPDGRTQHVNVGKLADEPDARPTTWIFDEGDALHLSESVYCVCVSDPNRTDACVRHGKSSSPGAASRLPETTNGIAGAKSRKAAGDKTPRAKESAIHGPGGRRAAP
jgi:hypothetical protein